MTRSLDEIDPGARYTAREACRFIPSAKGENLHIMTWYRWRKAGLFDAFRIGGAWYMWGAEILRLLHAGECPQWNGRTPAERDRAVIAAEKRRAEIAPRTQRRRCNDAQHEPTPRPTGRPRRPRHDQSERPPGPGV